MEESLESTILPLSHVDAWIMTTVKCLVTEAGRGGRGQRLYMQALKSQLPVAMSQSSAKIYKYVEEWQPEDIKGHVDDRGQVEQGTGSRGRRDFLFSGCYIAFTAIRVPSMRKG